jgi:hypothetical protein
MSDLSDDSLPDWTEEELAILRTAQDDRPSPRSLTATLTALSAGGAVASAAAVAKGASVVAAGKGGATIAAAGSATATATATAKLVSGVAIAKWVGAAALGGALVTGGVALVRPARDQTRASIVAAEREHVRARSDDARHVTTPFVPPSTPVAPAQARAPAAPPASSSTPSRAPVVRSQPDISSEIAAVDQARNVLRAQRPRAALAALDRYDARFGRAGALREEASALRIEALLESGKRERAKALARTFLAHHAQSPYAARVRALVAEPARF